MRRYNSLIAGLLISAGMFIVILLFGEVNVPTSLTGYWAHNGQQGSDSSNYSPWELDTEKEYRLVPLREKDPAIRFYTFEITDGYTYINGVKQARTLINGKFPGPAIQAIRGDEIVIEFINKSNRPSSLHLHGLSMRNTNFMDGMVGLTQCAVKPGKSFSYTFIAQDVGAYWYHSHVRADEILGLYGPVLIHDRNEEIKYDEDAIIMISDLYSQDPELLLEDYFEPYLGGNEPVPELVLVQGKIKPVLEISGNKRYRFHIINASSYLGLFVHIDNHLLEITGVDGYPVVRRTVHEIPITAAQRYSFYVQMDPSELEPVNREHRIQIKLENSNTSSLPVQVASAALLYDSDTDMLQETQFMSQKSTHNMGIETFAGFDLEFVPLIPTTVPEPSEQLVLEATMSQDMYGVMIPGFNNISSKMQDMPILSSFFGKSPGPSHHTHGSSALNQLQLAKGAVLDLTIVNKDDSQHPFHLHGHKFWVLERPGIIASTPIKRDTVWVDEDQWVKLRIEADNPGVWGFHCHNIWHAVGGMQYVLIVEPDEIKLQKPPREWWGLCDRDELPLIRLN